MAKVIKTRQKREMKTDCGRRGRLVLMGLCAAAAVILLVCFPQALSSENGGSGMGKNSNKVVVIGMDALDPKIIDRLIGAGRLPNFRRLKETGSYSTLQTTIPPETPVAWSVAATGTDPGNTNIFDYINRDPETYVPHLSIIEEKSGFLKTGYVTPMKGVPFWRITSRAGIPTTVMRWPVTFPPEEVKGNMLSGLGVIDIKGFLNSYRFYTSGEYDAEGEGAEKVVPVSGTGTIDTELFGPSIMRGGERAEATAPMRIRRDGTGAAITVDGKDYRVDVNGWSDWIRVKFDTGFMMEARGMFKAYLLSNEPDFSMYVTSIQVDPENPMVDISSPGDYAKRLADDIGLYYTMGMPEDTKAVTEGRISKGVFFEQIKQIDDERIKMFWHEFDGFEKLDRGVYAFGFDSTDRLQHIFWTDRMLAGNASSFPPEIVDRYGAMDSFLGELLGRLDNRTSLIVFSDHGFTSYDRSVSINAWLVKNGYMALTKEPDEKHAGELFSYVDWSRTKAYSVGFASIYLNLEGREGKGIVSESEKDSLKKEIISKLGGLTDPKTGKKAIVRLYDGAEAYSAGHADNAPDIVVGFEQGYRMSWQNSIGGVTPWIISDNKGAWRGDHLVDRSRVPGVLFTNFKTNHGNPSLADIAPTVLSIVGIDVPPEMTGKSLHG